MTKMPADFVKNQKGNLSLVEHSFVYNLEKISADGLKKMWRCEQRKTCKARLHTDGASGDIVSRIGQHTHAACKARVEVMKAIDILKDRALNTQDTTRQVSISLTG